MGNFSGVQEMMIQTKIMQIISTDNVLKKYPCVSVRKMYTLMIDRLDLNEFKRYVSNIEKLSKNQSEKITRFAVDACEVFKAKLENKACVIRCGQLFIAGKNTYNHAQNDQLDGFEEDEEELPNIDDEY